MYQIFAMTLRSREPKSVRISRHVETRNYWLKIAHWLVQKQRHRSLLSSADVQTIQALLIKIHTCSIELIPHRHPSLDSFGVLLFINFISTFLSSLTSQRFALTTLEQDKDEVHNSASLDLGESAWSLGLCPSTKRVCATGNRLVHGR